MLHSNKYIVHRPPAVRLHAQRGISLFVVIVFVMLSMLLALWASRSALFNEMMVGNDADYQRAFEAAQALIQDAELDIRNETAKGGTCAVGDDSTGRVCRNGGDVMKAPLETPEVPNFLNALASVPFTQCKDGLCAKRLNAQDFWNNQDPALGVSLPEMMKATVGARYGEFTGASFANNTNPILAIRGAKQDDKGGWYWIEVMPYMEAAGNSGLIANAPSANVELNLSPNVVYRITAIAFGRKSNTQVVLQQTYARQRTKD